MDEKIYKMLQDVKEAVASQMDYKQSDIYRALQLTTDDISEIKSVEESLPNISPENILEYIRPTEQHELVVTINKPLYKIRYILLNMLRDFIRSNLISKKILFRPNNFSGYCMSEHGVQELNNILLGQLSKDNEVLVTKYALEVVILLLSVLEK